MVCVCVPRASHLATMHATCNEFTGEKCSRSSLQNLLVARARHGLGGTLRKSIHSNLCDKVYAKFVCRKNYVHQASSAVSSLLLRLRRLIPNGTQDTHTHMHGEKPYFSNEIFSRYELSNDSNSNFPFSAKALMRLRFATCIHVDWNETEIETNEMNLRQFKWKYFLFFFGTFISVSYRIRLHFTLGLGLGLPQNSHGTAAAAAAAHSRSRRHRAVVLFNFDFGYPSCLLAYRQLLCLPANLTGTVGVVWCTTSASFPHRRDSFWRKNKQK